MSYLLNNHTAFWCRSSWHHWYMRNNRNWESWWRCMGWVMGLIGWFLMLIFFSYLLSTCYVLWYLAQSLVIHLMHPVKCYPFWPWFKFFNAVHFVSGLKFFTMNDYSLQFVFYFLYINLQIALAFLAAAMFSNIKTAAGLVLAIWFYF